MPIFRKDTEIRNHAHLMDAEGCADYEATEIEINELLSHEGYAASDVSIFFDDMMKLWRWHCKIIPIPNNISTVNNHI